MKSAYELAGEWYSTSNEVKQEDYVTLSLLKKDFIKDENKSVAWNRDFVTQNNEEYQKQNKAFRYAFREKQDEFEKAIIEALSDEEGLTYEETEIVFRHAYQESHSSGYQDVVGTAYDLCGLVTKIKELGQ